MPDKRVTDAELAILKLMWEAGATTARDIRERLYPGETASDRATVQKLLERLEAKKLVSRDRSQFVHTFRPTLTRDEFVGEQIDQLAERLTGGSLTPLITQLIGKPLSKADRDALRKLLNNSKRG